MVNVGLWRMMVLAIEFVGTWHEILGQANSEAEILESLFIPAMTDLRCGPGTSI